MNQDTDIRELLGRALDGDEPPHRDLAHSSITRGDAARRRNRVLGGAGGVTLGVAAIVGTMALSQTGGAGVSPGGAVPTGEPLTVVTNLNIGDKQRDVALNMPALLNPLLPDGLQLKWSTQNNDGGLHTLAGGSFQLFGADGHDSLAFETQAAGTATSRCDVQPVVSEVPHLPVDCKTMAVPGGKVQSAVSVGTASDGKTTSCDATYQFTPTGQDKKLVMELYCGADEHLQLSIDQFVALVQKPGFTQVMDLADLAKPASAAAKQERVTIDAAIARAVGDTLPGGFKLRLATTNLMGQMDLVGPSGVAGFDWETNKPGMSVAESCATAGPSTSGCSHQKVAGGTLYEGHFNTVEHGLQTGYAFVSDGPDATEVSVELNSATSQHPLTPEQFLAIATAPGIDQVIAAVHHAIAAG